MSTRLRVLGALILSAVSTASAAGQLSYQYQTGRLGAFQETSADGTVTQFKAHRDLAGNLERREVINGVVELTVLSTPATIAPIRGNAAEFTFTVQNTDADFLAPDAGLSFTIPGAHRVISLVASPGVSCAIPALWCELGDLAPGQAASVTLSFAPQGAAGTTLVVEHRTHLIGAQTPLRTAASGSVTPIASTIAGDKDADGMPDQWESNNGLDPLYAPDASDDPDGDNTTNLNEYIRQSNPQFNEGLFGVVFNLLLGPLDVWTPRLNVGSVGSAYSQTLVATGGTAPYTWSVSSGQLPSGLTLNTTTGEIAGTPTTVQTQVMTVQVQDANQRTSTRALTFVTAN